MKLMAIAGNLNKDYKKIIDHNNKRDSDLKCSKWYDIFDAKRKLHGTKDSAVVLVQRRLVAYFS